MAQIMYDAFGFGIGGGGGMGVFIDNRSESVFQINNQSVFIHEGRGVAEILNEISIKISNNVPSQG
jgi:hypothetical protein